MGRKTIEQLAHEIFKECERDGEPVTIQEAEEMARMELGAKGMSREATSTEPRKKSDKPRTVKISDTKKMLFELIADFLSEEYGYGSITRGKNCSSIALNIEDTDFDIKIIQHRKK